MVKKTFINLPVKDLNRTIDFFKKLGFEFNPEFSNEDAICMILNDNTFVMFLVEKFFNTFTVKEISDTKINCEVINCIEVESREIVNDIVTRAIGAGANEPNDPKDHGWMYLRGFQDLDGHIWEVSFMDINKMANS